ncbi:hypothetical protein EYR40_003654 [Pleurotus pulmonarius]|nr:hypothetical protein EYR40_003654 [Pleurotus pulmonarius]KAF4606368.1 hypothetical protein EYR38_000421 [Pleurotus pulmonarius]
MTVTDDPDAATTHDGGELVAACEAVLRHVVDVHCHPTDSPATLSPDSMHRLPITICPMASRKSDQPRVRALAQAHPDKVIPGFGQLQLHHFHCSTIHPDHEDIFAELLESLPEPILLFDVLAELKQNLLDFPNAMLGEVGIDRSFRIPIDYDASPRKLTPFTVPLEHQLSIVEAQLQVAVDLGRNISFHSVKAQKATLDLMDRMVDKHGDRWYRISADMHSCGFSPQTWTDVQRKHCNIFLSLSTTINEKSPNHRELIAVCSPNRLLVESDFNDIGGCAERTWEMVKIVADVKGWAIEDEWVQGVIPEESWGVVRRLERSFQLFRQGQHTPPAKKRSAATSGEIS